MSTRAALLAVGTAFAVASAVAPGAAHAAPDVNTAPTGMTGAGMTGAGMTGTGVRNGVASAGLPPQWVQPPYLSRRGERYVLRGSAYLDPLRTSASGRKQQDRFTFAVEVGKKRYTRPARPQPPTLLPDSQLLQRNRRGVPVRAAGLAQLRLMLSRSTSRSLSKRGFRGRRLSVAVTVEHHKDTRARTPARDLVQITGGLLVRRAYTAQQQAGLTRLARRASRANRPGTHGGQGRAAGTVGMAKHKYNSGEPFYNYVYVQNNTPFQQQVNFQPDVQCMWVGISTAYQIQPNPQKAKVAAGGTVTFSYQGYWDAFPPPKSQTYQPPFYSPYPGIAGATKGMDAPGTQGQQATALSQAANAAGQNAVQSIGSGSTYVDSGAIGAAVAAGVEFTIAFFKGLAKQSTCTQTATYPQTFGLTTAVTAIGSNAVAEAADATLPPTAGWVGNPAAGNQSSSTAPGPGFEQAYLQQALGAQTSAMYYWNGGQPAYMVSNNAASGQFTGGAATFTGGLIQYIGPNPGLPDGVSQCSPNSVDCAKKYPKCTMGCTYDPAGAIQIQLSYLTNPDFASGLVSQGQPPTLTATVDSSGDYALSCDLSRMAAVLYTPFGESAPTSISGTTLATQPTNTGGTLPRNAEWLVNFYGIDADGNYVYYSDSLQPATNGVTQPYLGPNAASQPISIQAAATSGSGSQATGVVSAADMTQMATLSGTASTPVTFGCNATPSVDLPGLAVNLPGTDIGDAFGSNWPVPVKVLTGWPATAFAGNAHALNWQGMTAVTRLNVQFRGLPVGDTTPVPPPVSAS